MKKNMIIFVVIALMAISFTACSSKTSKAESQSSGEAVQTEAAKETEEPEATKEAEVTSTPEATKEVAATEKPEKVAYLTFDDGPSDNTQEILDILDKNNVKATFFVIYQPKYKDVYKEITDKGHTIALHSYTHDYAKIYKSEDAFFNDINKLSEYVKSVTGVESKFLRFPGGTSNTVSRKYCSNIMSTLSKSVVEKGYSYFDWNVSSGDASGTTVDKNTIVSNVKKGVSGIKSAVILMHDAEAKTTTVDALPEIIKNLKDSGYTLLPITEDTKECHHPANN